MIELSSAELSRWVASYLWVLFRIASLLMTMPVLGTQLLPVRVRLYFALALTLLIAPQVGEVPLLDALSLSTWIVIGEQI
ncbi:MAG: flagellar biosynthetic protein FliR, partial [Pseudomonadales bacterium]|nr:flagellar biosynthetic protein FliR [Pseudomonadales bacterium]